MFKELHYISKSNPSKVKFLKKLFFLKQVPVFSFSIKGCFETENRYRESRHLQKFKNFVFTDNVNKRKSLCHNF